MRKSRRLQTTQIVLSEIFGARVFNRWSPICRIFTISLHVRPYRSKELKKDILKAGFWARAQNGGMFSIRICSVWLGINQIFAGKKKKKKILFMSSINLELTIGYWWTAKKQYFLERNVVENILHQIKSKWFEVISQSFEISVVFLSVY